MTNYCSNNLSINGENLQEILDFIRDENVSMCFENIIPLNSGDAYDLWGVSCEPQTDSHYSELNGENNPEGAMVSFDTAWSAPFAVIDALQEKYPDNEFILEYYESSINSGTYSGKIKCLECETESTWDENLEEPNGELTREDLDNESRCVICR